MAFVDTNVVLRWLLDDHALSSRARQIVATARPAELCISDVIVAEIVYVFASLGKDRGQLGPVFEVLSRTPAFAFEHEALIGRTIEILAQTTLDFADCYLIARATMEGSGLHTFDKAMQATYDNLAA